MVAGDPRLRFRVWVERRLVLEQWVDVLVVTAAGQLAMQDEHTRIAMEASAAGKPWLVEVYDPEQAEDHAYLRFGTDRDGMVAPHTVEDGAQLAAVLLGRGPDGGPAQLAEDDGAMYLDQQFAACRHLDRAELGARIRDGLASHGLNTAEYLGEVEAVVRLALPDQ